MLAGRKLSWKLYCYSYREFLRSIGEESEFSYSKTFQSKQPSLFSRYLSEGGFPESSLFQAEAGRGIYFQDTTNDIIFRDAVLRHNISKPNEFKIMTYLVLSMMGCRMSETKLYQRLSGMNVRISKPLMTEYLGYLADTAAVFMIPVRSPNKAVQMVNPKKVYIADHAVSQGLTQDISARLENIVFLHLKRKTDQMFYYVTQKGNEVDFACGPDSSIELVQVSSSIASERETRALSEAMAELGIGDA